MKESSFELKQNTEQPIDDAREKLRSLAADVSNRLLEKEELSKIKEDFIKIQPAIEKEIKEYIKTEKESEIHFASDQEYTFYFELINKLNLLDESNKEMAAEFFTVSDGIDQIIANDILNKRQIYKSQEENTEQNNYLADYILKKFDFSEEEVSDIIKGWLSTEEDSAASWLINQNLKNIRGLENFEKKSTKSLYSNFGIRNFGRYQMSELKKQYNEKDDMGDYGLFFTSVADWNGALASDESKEIREKTEENSYILRIIEANGKIDLAKRLLYLKDKYNQKIKFMYMHMHGNTDVVGFGDEEGNNRMLLQEDLKGKGVQRIKELFADNAELILSGCLTGVKGGLAEEMSNTYNIKVNTADKPKEGDPKSIEIKKNSAGDNLEFNVEFNTVDEYDGEDNKQTIGTIIYKPKN